MPPKINREERQIKEAAQYADIIRSPRFREVSDTASSSAEDGEQYSVWRQNVDGHLGSLISSLMKRSSQSTDEKLWNIQREVAVSAAIGEPIGPFEQYFNAFTDSTGKPVTVVSGTGGTDHIPTGEHDVINSNNVIRRFNESFDSPMEFLNEATDFMRERRRLGGRRFEGPENYATMLKYFSDKTKDAPLDSATDKKHAKSLVDSGLGNFLRVAEDDAPNIIEITNILSTVKNLPKGMVDERFTGGVLRHTLELLPEFSEKGTNLILGAISKLDISMHGEAAAMLVDLTLRRDQQFSRIGEMIVALRAVAHLPKADASERAFTSLLNARNKLEVAADLNGLEETNKLLYKIVTDVTENPDDSKRSKSAAEYIARKAVVIYKDTETGGSLDIAEMQAKHRQVSRIIDIARRM